MASDKINKYPCPFFYNIFSARTFCLIKQYSMEFFPNNISNCVQSFKNDNLCEPRFFLLGSEDNEKIRAWSKCSVPLYCW